MRPVTWKPTPSTCPSVFCFGARVGRSPGTGCGSAILGRPPPYPVSVYPPVCPPGWAKGACLRATPVRHGRQRCNGPPSRSAAPAAALGASCGARSRCRTPLRHERSSRGSDAPPPVDLRDGWVGGGPGSCHARVRGREEQRKLCPPSKQPRPSAMVWASPCHSLFPYSHPRLSEASPED